MKNLIMIIVIMAINISCVSVSTISTSSGIDESYLSIIPIGAAEIVVTKNTTSEFVLYAECLQILMSKGYGIVEDEKNYILTDGKELTPSTYQRMMLIFSYDKNVGTVIIKTDWKVGDETVRMAQTLSMTQEMNGFYVHPKWNIATWHENSIGFAFAESVSVAKMFKNGTISYKK